MMRLALQRSRDRAGTKSGTTHGIYLPRAAEPWRAVPRQNRGFGLFVDEIIAMKIALLALLGLVLGALGGAALGIGAGLAWVEIFKTTDFEGYSSMLVFFTCMPLGAMIGGLGGALLFGVIAIRDAEIAIEREPVRHDN